MSTRRKKAATVAAKNNRGRIAADFLLEDLHSYRVDRKMRTIYVGSDPENDDERGVEVGVEHRMADRFDINLGLLASIDRSAPILVNLASCGGNWSEGMQMFGAILACPCPVTVIATKWARSMTSLIPLAADRFVIRPPAKYMIHLGSIAFSGTQQEFKTYAIEAFKSNEMMERIYVARLLEQGMHKHKGPDEVRGLIKGLMQEHIDVWFDNDEAVAWGFADAVFDGDHDKLRAQKVNAERRERMREVLQRPINITVTAS